MACRYLDNRHGGLPVCLHPLKPPGELVVPTSGGVMFEPLLRDGRTAVRAILSAPTYAVVSMATLALVIGAASAVLAVVNATMIRPLPFPDGDRIVQVFSLPPGVSGVAQRNPLHTRVFFRFRSGGVRLVDALEGIWARERVLGGEGEEVW